MKKTFLLAALLGVAAPVASAAVGGYSIDLGYDNTKLTTGGDTDLTFNGIRASVDMPVLPLSGGMYVSVNASAYYDYAGKDMPSPAADTMAKASQSLYGGDVSFVGNVQLADCLVFYTGLTYAVGTYKSEYKDKGFKGDNVSEHIDGYGYVAGLRFYIGQNFHVSAAFRQINYKDKDDWSPKTKSFNVGVGLTF